MYRLMGLVVLLMASIVSQAANDQCLIVRSAEGHRFRNSMIAGALTGVSALQQEPPLAVPSMNMPIALT